MRLFISTTSPYARIARIALFEKGLRVEPTVVDPWSDDPQLRAANPATRVPTLITDDGMPLTECLLIVQWLEATRPPPAYPSLLGADPTAVLSRAGIAMGVIDAAAITIITRRVTAPVLFDETPVGLRRRRSMAEGIARLEAIAAQTPFYRGGTPTLDAITAAVALEYLRFRFADAPWLPVLPALERLAGELRQREAFAQSVPH